MPIDFIQAQEFSSNHKERLLKDKLCGCFYCLKIYNPSEIQEWIADEAGTAVCPYCKIDSVIGASSGYPITESFLQTMKNFWFSSTSFTNSIKKMASKMGADLCGIAASSSFAGTPTGSHPLNALFTCKSVIVLARHYPPMASSVQSASPRTIIRKDLSNTMNDLAARIANKLAAEGYDALPIPSSAQEDYYANADKYPGTISLKHAAQLAGLGRIDSNELLMNDRFGNMLCFSAVLTSAELDPDTPCS